MESFGLTNTYSSLHPVLRGDNPDSSFSEVPYEKGFQLLYYMESLIGRPEMKSFLNFYIAEHKLTSITTIHPLNALRAIEPTSDRTRVRVGS